jgi:hypothetical protein
MSVDVTAPGKKKALAKKVHAWNLAHPKKLIAAPKGFDPETKTIGPSAREYLKALERAAGRDVTGQFNRETMAWLLPPDIRGKVMSIAHGELGVHEWPPGSNSGEVRKYLTAAGYPWAGAWCVSFIYWTLLQAGFKREHLPTGAASTPNWATFARAHKCTKPISQSLAGDIWLFEWGNGDGMLDHGAFCDDPNPRNATGLSLDGNVGANGGTVTQVARPASTIAVCIDLKKLHNLS